mgnify:CR=1 FL=1
MYRDPQNSITLNQYKNTEELLLVLASKLAPFKDWLCNEGSFNQLRLVDSICSIKELGLDFSSLLDKPERPDSEHGLFMMETYAPLLDSYKQAIDELKHLKSVINAKSSSLALTPALYESQINSNVSPQYVH